MVSKKKARSIARRDTIARRKQGQQQQQQLAAKKSESEVRKQIAPKPSSLTQSRWFPCGHGWDASEYPEGHDCKKCIDLVLELETFDRRPDQTILDDVVFPVMKTAESKYPEVWKDVTKMKWIASAFISLGVRDIINDERGWFPYFAATFAECTRQKIAALEINEDEAVPELYIQRLDEVLNIDERRVIGYLKKRIPCSCLDEKYEEVKHLPKKGICFGCSALVEVSEMWSCEGCRREHYCSERCQADRWHDHKSKCKFWRELKAARGDAD